jgi:alpha-ketoglutarate-dependent taurine dioxygenase
MKIQLHENNWTVLVEDLDLRYATQEEIDTIARYVSTNTVVVVRDQILSERDEVDICERIGRLEDFSKYYDIPGGAEIMRGKLAADGDRKIIRVTGEPDEHGDPGLFGHVSDLDWHCNQAANEWRDPIVWLYGVRGTAGSRTSWINNISSYRDLPEETKRQYASIQMINGYKQGAYSESVFGKPVDINYNYTPNLVHTNNAGETGLFFPFLQIHQIVGMSEDESRDFINNLRRHVEQEKYMYHHDWQDGDVVISEQWLGIHKRWEFEGMDKRVLHRITLDFSNIVI